MLSFKLSLCLAGVVLMCGFIQLLFLSLAVRNRAVGERREPEDLFLIVALSYESLFQPVVRDGSEDDSSIKPF